MLMAPAAARVDASTKNGDSYQAHGSVEGVD